MIDYDEDKPAKKSWQQAEQETLNLFAEGMKELRESNMHETYSKFDTVRAAIQHLSHRAQENAVNEHTAKIYRRMIQEFQSNDQLMEMFTDLLSHAKLLNDEFEQDLRNIDKEYGQ